MVLLQAATSTAFSQELMNWFQVGAWAVAIVGGLVAVFKGLAELKRANRQREEDMRWKRAEMAKKCLDELAANSLATDALRMLDWNNLTYTTPKGRETGRISHEARRKALRTQRTLFHPDGDERFVRDAFDALFDNFQMLGHFLTIKLIVFEDVRQPLTYYVKKLSRRQEYEVMEEFLTEYQFHAALQFLERFPHWQERKKPVRKSPESSQGAY